MNRNTDIDNRSIYDGNWTFWLDMKAYGPTSRWLRYLLAECLKELPKTEEIKTILDVGCGEGSNTHFLAERFSEAATIGFDFSATAVEYAQRRWHKEKLTFIHRPGIEKIPDTFDLVSAFEVLEHVEDWRSFLNEMLNRSDQYILLSFPTGRMRNFEKYVGHYRNFKKGEVEEFLKARNFMCVMKQYAGFPFYSPLYRNVCDSFDHTIQAFSSGEYGLSQKLIAVIIYIGFRFFSTRLHWGDQFCGLFKRTDAQTANVY